MKRTLRHSKNKAFWAGWALFFAFTVAGVLAQSGILGLAAAASLLLLLY